MNKEDLQILYDDELFEITFNKFIKPTNDKALIVKIKLGRKPTNNELVDYIGDVRDIILGDK